MEEDPACCVLAGGAMSKLAAKLDGLLIRSQGRPHHMPIPWEVKNELIPLIKQNLEIMMAIIQDDGDDNSTRAVIRCLTKEVRELSYDIHDCIDEHTAGPASDHATRLLWRMERHVRVAKANDKRRGSTGLARRRTSSKPKPTWLSERLKGRLWLLDKMREFSARSEESLRRYNSFNRPLKKQRNEDSNGDSSTSASASATRSGESFGSWSPPSNAHIVRWHGGIHDFAMNTLKTWLTDGDSRKLKVVSIVGCGGIGKTTLANELYRRIGGQFECQAFVRTSQKPDVRRLLISILSQIRPQHHPANSRVHNLIGDISAHLQYESLNELIPGRRGSPSNWKVNNLIGDIRTHLQDKRYFIVIDDIWARSTWDVVNRAFPDGKHRSRILITSELEDIALKCCGYEPQYVYKMKTLSEDDSRKLFYNIVGCSQDLTAVSDSIIRKCGGLPLAIVTIASLLASRTGKAEQREYVEYVDKSLGYGLMKNLTLEGMKQVVSLSYRNLPQHLKACMLYLCMFPEGYIIWTDALVNQWIAEGFICSTDGKDEQEISSGYFDELINSRLIHPVHIDGNDKVLSCTMHHVIRNHIMQESIVENFVAAIDYSQTATSFPHKVRRLSLNFGNAEDATLSTNMRLSQVRTLAFFGAYNCVPSITGFRLLQILILHFWGEEERIKFDLTSISEIFRLRYLQVTCNVKLEIQQMQMLQHLQYLETLKIDAARGSIIPSDIVHLPRLLHLRLPAETNLLSGIGHMTSLRTLGHFDLSTNSIDKVRDLGKLTNVQDLQLTLTLSVGPSCYLVEKMECLSSVLGKLNNLKCITLKRSRVVDLGCQPSSMIISCDVLSSVSSPPALLQRLEWLPRICTFSSLPEWIGHLGKLCILKVGVRELVRNDVDLLKGLPALTVLSLYVHTKPAEIIVFSKGGFLVLKYFRFRCSVPCLKFEADVMPNLRKLKLGFDEHGTTQYGPIPAGLDHLSGLKEISAKIGGSSANEQVRRIVESALSDAISMHPGLSTVNIHCVDQMFGDEDDPNIRLQEETCMTPQKRSEPIEEHSNEHVTLQKGSREDAASRKNKGRKVVRVPVRTTAGSGPTGKVVPSDIWAWRKYGQKPYTRGYYKCSSKKCPARKKVERSRTDPNMLVITYTSEHNHTWPTQRNALAGSTRSQHGENDNSSAGGSSGSGYTCSRSEKQSQPNNVKEERNNHQTATTKTTTSTVSTTTSIISSMIVKSETAMTVAGSSDQAFARDQRSMKTAAADYSDMVSDEDSPASPSWSRMPSGIGDHDPEKTAVEKELDRPVDIVSPVDMIAVEKELDRPDDMIDLLKSKQKMQISTYNDGGYGQASPKCPPSYGGPADDNAPPPSSYGGNNVYRSDSAVLSPRSYGGARGSYPGSYGAPSPNPYSGGAPGGQGGLMPTYDGSYGGRSVPGSGGAGRALPTFHGGYTKNATPEPATKVKQCDANCEVTCDNARIYISNLPPDVTVEELQELFGGIGQIGRIKQKRGYKDQWPWDIKIYADDSGKNKGDACLTYEDPSAAHSAGGFYNRYDMRGNKLSVVMAEKSAPKNSTSGHVGGRGGGGHGGDRPWDGGSYGPNRNQGGGSRSRPY